MVFSPYDPRGSVAGLADARGHLTRTYQYSVTGEPTYGAAAYENEYAYNGESYSPNIHSQYLRARYYSVATASFLSEASYLGSIWGPLTLNRYNYCISSYPNYRNPSGNTYDGYFSPGSMLELQYLLTGDEEYSRLAEEQLKREMRMEYYEAFNMAGVVDSVLASIGKTVVTAYNIYADVENAYMETVASAYNASFGRFTRKLKYDSLSKIAVEEVDSYLERRASKVWDMDCYYIGRCEGDVMLTVAEAAMLAKGAVRLQDTLKNGIKLVPGGGERFALDNGMTMGAERAVWVLDKGAILEGVLGAAGEETLAGLGWYHAASDIWGSYSKIDWDKGSTGFGWDSEAGGLKEIYSSIKESPNYPEDFTRVQNGTKKVTINNGPLLMI